MTRCNIHFAHGETVSANIYRHCDGYPGAVKPDLQQFFADVKSQTKEGWNGTRFDDASYLAARFVVWQAAHYASDSKPLNFISLGVVNKDAPDGKYIYHVDCDNHDENGYPKVTYRSV